MLATRNRPELTECRQIWKQAHGSSEVIPKTNQKFEYGAALKEREKPSVI
jgi:hypothetical protein